jgi:hypothetical protein
MYAAKSLLAASAFCLMLGAAEGRDYKITASAEGVGHPIVSGRADLPDGTILSVILKKPWLPDAQQRLSRGLPACEDDCLPSQDSVQVQQGIFRTRPFSFGDKPIRAGEYDIEIWLPVRPGETLEQLRSEGRLKPIFTAVIQVSESNKALQPGPALRHEPGSAEVAYRSRFFVAGVLFRAGEICSQNYKRLADAAFDMLDDPELKHLSGAFPETTKQWMLEGATSLNTGVMHDGIEKTCADVEHMRAQAAQVIKPSR